jgi:uncharacterized iron-regulated membrane protein
VRLLRSLHRWTGLVLALVVAAVALTGGLLLLRDPYLRFRHPELAAAIDPAETARRGELLDAIHARFAADGVRVVRFPRPGVNAFHVWLDDGSESLVDPRTGAVLDRWRWHERLPAFLFELHAHLLLGAPGTVINGIAALATVFLALTGVLLWGRRPSAFPLRRAAPARLRWRDLLQSHAAVGALTVVPVLVFVLTGAGMTFHGAVASGLAAAFDRVPAARPSAVIAPRDAPRQPSSAVLRAVHAAFPRGELAMYTRGAPSNAVLTFRVRNPGEMHPNGRSYVLVDPYDATVVQAIDATTQGAGTRAAHAIYPLHAARTGGPALVVLAAVAAAGLAWLAVGGSAALLLRPRPARRGAPRVASSGAHQSAHEAHPPSPATLSSLAHRD